MPAPKFLSGLPKPVLFGLYGAVGGLIGALVFGELVWFLLRPQPPKPVEVKTFKKVPSGPNSSISEPPTLGLLMLATYTLPAESNAMPVGVNRLAAPKVRIGLVESAVL